MLNATRRRIGRLGRPFRLLLASDVLMLLSLMIGAVAVPWWIAREGGARDLALYGAAVAGVSFFAFPLLSPLGDRGSKRWLIAGGLGVVLLKSLVVAALAQAGLYRIGWIIAMEVIGAAAMALVWPVSMSIVAELLPPERLSEGLGLQKSAQSVGRLLGPVLGGAAITTGIAPALWLHAAMLLVACVLAARIETPPAAQRHRMPPRWLAELKAGLAAKWQVPLERGWTLVSFLVMVFFTPGIGMLVPLKVQSLGLSGAWLGACEAGLSAGMLFGALGGSMWLAQRVGRFRASFGALMCEGACFAVLGLAQWPLLVVAVFVLHGACVITVNMVGHTHRMLAMPAHFRARMTAVNLMVMQVAGALGPGLAGAALARWSVGQVYVAFGLGVFLAALGYLRVPGYRRFLELPHDEAEGHYARLHPQLFGTSPAEGTDREGFAARKSP